MSSNALTRIECDAIVRGIDPRILSGPALAELGERAQQERLERLIADR